MENNNVLYLEPIDGLRALATLGIFLYHARIFRQGSFPVTLFFMISGFMLYYTKHNLQSYSCFSDWIEKYVLRKLRKFYSLHVLTFVCAFLLNKTTLNFENIKSAVINLLFLQAFSETQWLSYNSLSWYLSVTVFLYIIGYFLIRFVNRHWDLAGTLQFVVLVIILTANLLYRKSNIGIYYIYAIPSIAFWIFYLEC